MKTINLPLEDVDVIIVCMELMKYSTMLDKDLRARVVPVMNKIREQTKDKPDV
jgi:hypothetical protein